MRERIQTFLRVRTGRIAGAGLLLVVLVAVAVLQPWSTQAQDPVVPPTSASTAEEFSGEAERQSNCLQDVLEAYSALGYNPGEDSAIAFRLETDMKGYRLGNVPEATSVTDFVITGESLSVVGDGYEMYRDRETQVIVDWQTESIRLYTIGVDQTPNDNTSGSFLQAQQKMLRACKVVKCKERVERNGETLTRVTLSPNPTEQRLFNVLEATVWLSDAGTRLRGVDVVPFTTRDYSSLSWTFHDIRVVPLPDEFLEPVYRRILDADGKVSGRYSEMTIIDERVSN